MNKSKTTIKSVSINDDYIITVGDHSLGDDRYGWDRLSRYFVSIERLTPRAAAEFIEWVEVGSYRSFETLDQVDVYIEQIIFFVLNNGINPETQFK